MCSKVVNVSKDRFCRDEFLDLENFSSFFASFSYERDICLKNKKLRLVHRYIIF